MTTRHFMAAGTLAFALAFTPTAFADQHETGTGHEGHAAQAQGQPLSDASKEFEAAMQRMHKGMTEPYTNDVDVDFVRGMIPHHQGAIEQAQVLLKYSKNPRLRRLAGGIIAAQRREIRFMEKWLKEHAQGAETADMPDWLKSAPSTPEGANTAGAKD